MEQPLAEVNEKQLEEEENRSDVLFKELMTMQSQVMTAMEIIRGTDFDSATNRVPILSDTFKEYVETVFKSYYVPRDCPEKMKEKYITEVAEASVRKKIIKKYCWLIYAILSNPSTDDASIKPLHNMFGHLLNMSDFHEHSTMIITRHTKFMKTCIQMLNDFKEPHLQKTLEDRKTKLLEKILGLIHNLAQIENNVRLLRNLNIISAVKPYLASTTSLNKLRSLAILADVVDEENREILNNNDDVIIFVIRCLQEGMDAEDRRSKMWSVREITHTIRMIARHDNNKRTVVMHGAIALLVELAQKTEKGSVEEQREAVHALWTLSFDMSTRSKMIQNTHWSVIDTFNELLKDKDNEVQSICKKALWNMRYDLKSSLDYKHIADKFLTHVMLSYNWGNQHLVKMIAKDLEKEINVWMDVKDLHGSTLEAMASAVERADVVLVCYSEKYQNSNNCRAEASYAFDLKKTIIPVRMENYNPDGWLALVIAGKLRIDFSDKKKYNDAIIDLKTEVNAALGKKTIAGEAARQSIQVKNRDIDEVKKWTPEDVAKWLGKNNLPKNLLKSGIEVVFLHFLVHESPDVYYKTIGEQLGVREIRTMGKLRFALEVLDKDISVVTPAIQNNKEANFISLLRQISIVSVCVFITPVLACLLFKVRSNQA